MSTLISQTLNPTLDLVLERVIDVPPQLVWKAWTTPALLMPWFCPKPWSVSECRIDLKPGGEFFTVMQSPEGESFPSGGCYLEVVPTSRLTWTSSLTAGYRPAPAPDSAGAGFHMTASILLEPHGSGTKYTAIAMHTTEESRQQHETMGFHDGWGTALDQLVAFVKTM